MELALEILPQVLLDGIVLGFMYALIALGYTMVYGVLEFINFAHSEIFVLGAFVGVGDDAAAAERRLSRHAPSRVIFIPCIRHRDGRSAASRRWRLSASPIVRSLAARAWWR